MFGHLSALPLLTQRAHSSDRARVRQLNMKPNSEETSTSCSLNLSNLSPSLPPGVPEEALLALPQVANIRSPAPDLSPSLSLIATGPTLLRAPVRVPRRARGISAALLTRGVTPNDLPPILTFPLLLTPKPALSLITSKHGKSFDRADGFYR